jgi:hypothetical protein
VRAREDDHEDVGLREALVGVSLAVDAGQRECGQRRADGQGRRLLGGVCGAGEKNDQTKKFATDECPDIREHVSPPSERKTE